MQLWLPGREVDKVVISSTCTRGDFRNSRTKASMRCIKTPCKINSSSTVKSPSCTATCQNEWEVEIEILAFEFAFSLASLKDSAVNIQRESCELELHCMVSEYLPLTKLQQNGSSLSEIEMSSQKTV